MTYGRAVVVGGGIGGLITARVLSDHFAEVLLIDRDVIPAAPSVRAGIPQSSHFHALQSGGMEIMSDLIPELEADLVAGGCITPEADQFYVFTPQGKSYSLATYQPVPMSPPPGWPKTHFQSRGLLEHSIRKRIEAIPNITTHYETMVREPLVLNGKVTGVKISGSEEEIEADLTIDATGRVSRTLGWLDKLGHSRPEESHVNCDFAYTSVFLKPDDPSSFTDAGFFMGADPEGEYPKRGGALIRVEGGIWLATVGGRLGDHPPADIDSLMEYAKTLIEPSFYDLISAATPVSEPHHFKFPKSIRRHYEKLEAFPDGLLPVADAICHYNPVYGQGMSAASRQAVALGKLIEKRAEQNRNLDGLWQEFFPEAYEQTRAPWLFAALADFAQPGTTGDFPSEEQTSVENIMKLTTLSGDGNQEAGLLMAMVFTMRDSLSAIHDKDRLAAIGIG
ncbi:MAG: 2-polyprenyl-6-methoxyphenol hydroxylase-like FAD-dependent oxidoreductase [Candidatus Azotimanducaceae bacterium]|jgi:2-polyprenyl-6-methoxyphenol hydroxylase-like FAD-dependent oxidoreductase